MSAAEKAESEYSDGYMGQLQALGEGVDKKLHDSVIKEIQKPEYNVRHSDNPALDARMNYLQVRADMADKVAGTPVNPIKGEAVKNLGGSVGTESDVSTKPTPVMSKEAAEFAKEVGMSDEDVAEALGGELPTYLHGKI